MKRRIPTARARHALVAPFVVALALATVLTGCGSYQPELLSCRPQAPATAGDYQQVFDQRAAWAGGDGASTVTLPDDRVLWLFGDTFTDGLNPDGSPAGGFIRNSLVVQTGGCFSMLANGQTGARQDALAPAEKGEWLWPTSGVVNAAAGTVNIVSLRMQTAPGPVGWNWRVAGADISTLSLPGLVFVKTVHAPVAQDGAVVWGGNALTVANDVYLYGTTTNGRTTVARTTVSDMTTQPWQAYTGTGSNWSTDVSQAAAPEFDVTTRANLTVIPYRGGYLASAKSVDMLSDDVTTWFSPSPTGPFERVGRAATTTTPSPQWFTYGGRVVSLPGAGLTVIWSQNGDNVTDMNHYGPQFAKPLADALP